MQRTILLVLALALAGCGGRQPQRSADLITIGTYLASPKPNLATRRAATRQCNLRGQRTRYEATRIGPRGDYEHIYRCL